MKNQITKDALMQLRSVYKKTGTLIIMIDEDQPMSTIFIFALSVIKEFIIFCNSSFLHLLRKDVMNKTEQMSEHPQLNDKDNELLEKINITANNYSFDEFKQVYEIIKKVKDKFI